MSLTAICASTILTLSATGGSIWEHAARVDRLRLDGCQVRIEGDCYSACIMHLDRGLPHVCISPAARLHLHAPRGRAFGIRLAPEARQAYASLMAIYLPPGMAEWFKAPDGPGHHGTFSWQFRSISGAEVIRQGWAQPCPQ